MKTLITSQNSLLTILHSQSILILVALTLGAFALVQRAEAVNPPPDGGYPNLNTAEGDFALSSLTSGASNTAIGFNALGDNTTGSVNTATGLQALVSNTTGNNNTADGAGALNENTTGVENTATGLDALLSNNGDRNTADGFEALYYSTSGSSNTAMGENALFHNTTGSSNIALGFNAGLNLTTGDNNIDIGNSGVADEGSTIRIGDSSAQSATFIAGIYGASVANGLPVVVNSLGQLGVSTLSSSWPRTPAWRSFKREMRRWQTMNAKLRSDFLKEHRKVQDLEATVAQQQKSFESKLAQQHSEIEALRSGLQKVSAQLEVSKAAPQTVLSNQ